MSREVPSTAGIGQPSQALPPTLSAAGQQPSTQSDEHIPPSASIVQVTPSNGIDDSLPRAEQQPSNTSVKAGTGSENPHDRNHCQFVLLAEFDIDKGSTLSHQYPAPTGYNKHMLAELMLPDGAHARAEDWTIFFLKPHPSTDASAVRKSNDKSTRAPSMESLSLQETESGRRRGTDWSSDGLTYVINLVRTKHDSSVRRGALVKSMAIGTRHPYIDIFKPVLLLALDDYFKHPGTDCLARLFESINQLDISAAPAFNRAEKLILRASDRRDLFEERFLTNDDRDGGPDEPAIPPSDPEHSRTRAESGSTMSEETRSIKKKHSAASLRPASPGTRRASSATSLAYRRPSQPSPLPNRGKPRDTHFYDTTLAYRQIPLPIRIPLTIFPEEVGEYSLIKLIQTFSGPQSTPHGPLHPHLHSNGYMTHPIILLFNALITQKRIVFLGHGQPANVVAGYVLAACALGSGCGAIFRGFASRAFPYTNLMNLDELETIPGYIAGVTNPRFEDLHAWDVLLNVETGKVQVSKDLTPPPPPPMAPAVQRSQMTRDTFSSNSISSLAGNASFGYESSSKASSEFDPAQFSALPQPPPIKVAGSSSGRDRSGTLYDNRSDSYNNVFMDDILSAIQAHYGERFIRSRITDFVSGFAKSVFRHEEHVYGHTKLGPPGQPFLNGQLGSGPVYADKDVEVREIVANQVRVEGFRTSIPYRLFLQDEQELHSNPPLVPFDLSHQISRLKRARQLAVGESERIFLALSSSIVSEDQMIELLSLLPSHTGGLLPLGFGLFHPDAAVRDGVVDFFLRLTASPIGRKFVQSLNTYHRLAFARLANDRMGKMEEKEEERGEGKRASFVDTPAYAQAHVQSDHPFKIFTPPGVGGGEEQVV